MPKETILVLCAHNDDHTIGAGGTIAKYKREGKKIVVVIFSYGENTHLWLKKKVTIKMRVEESKRSDKILGIKNVVYLGLTESKFKKEFKEKNIEKKLTRVIERENPSKIFTHSIDDPHPDHRAVYNLALSITDKIKYKGEIYSFEIWNPVNLRKRDNPKLVVDITKTFDKKINAIKTHKSQKMSIISLLWNVYRKDFFHGLSNHCRFAEIFYKIR